MNKNSDLYEPISPEDPLSAQVYFDSVLKRLNIDLNDPKRQLLLQWNTLVGDNFKGHCVCSGIKEGTVFVTCDHPSYVSMFKMTSKEILKKIQTTFPELKVGKFSVKLTNK